MRRTRAPIAPIKTKPWEVVVGALIGHVHFNTGLYFDVVVAPSQPESEHGPADAEVRWWPLWLPARSTVVVS